LKQEAGTSTDGDGETKNSYPLMNFYLGNGEGIVKPVPVSPRCHPSRHWGEWRHSFVCVWCWSHNYFGIVVVRLHCLLLVFLCWHHMQPVIEIVYKLATWYYKMIVYLSAICAGLGSNVLHHEVNANV